MWFKMMRGKSNIVRKTACPATLLYHKSMVGNLLTEGNTDLKVLKMSSQNPPPLWQTANESGKF
jgi:hypothetical protein